MHGKYLVRGRYKGTLSCLLAPKAHFHFSLGAALLLVRRNGGTVSLAVVSIYQASLLTPQGGVSHLLTPLAASPHTPGAAQWVGDAACASLYHGQLEVKCVPWLPEEPVAGLDLDLLPVSAVMHAPVTTVQASLRGAVDP